MLNETFSVIFKHCTLRQMSHLATLARKEVGISIIIISLHKSWTKLRLSRNFLCDSNNNALTLILEADKHHDPWSKSFSRWRRQRDRRIFFQVWCWQICAHPSWILAIQRCVKLLCFFRLLLRVNPSASTHRGKGKKNMARIIEF